MTDDQIVNFDIDIAEFFKKFPETDGESLLIVRGGESAMLGIKGSPEIMISSIRLAMLDNITFKAILYSSVIALLNEHESDKLNFITILNEKL